MLKHFNLVLLLVVTSTNVLPATTYYVATTGNDSNDGSSTLPWGTIQHAADSVAAGDTVNIGSGTYSECVTLTGSGTAGNPIILVGSNVVIACNLTILGDYVTVSGITDSPPSAGGYYAITVGGQNDILTNCTVVNYGAAASDQATAIGIGGASNLVVNCTVRDLDDIDAFHVFGHDQMILGCTVTNLNQVNYGDNHTDFIQTWDVGVGSYNVVVKNCLLVNSTCQIGNTETDGSSDLHDWTFENDVFANVANTLFSGLPNTRFYNCVFYRCAGPGSPLDTPITFYTIDPNYDSSGSEVVNCVLLGCGTNPAAPGEGTIGSNGTDLTILRITHNYFAGSDYATKSPASGAYIGTHYVNGGNPYFANEANYDFHLTRNSTILIGSGTNLFSVFTSDRDGNARPSVDAWDIGSYQYSHIVPAFSSMVLSGTNLTMKGTNGLRNEDYVVLSSTNLSLPITNWESLSTNAFDGGGSFIFTNSIELNTLQRFYLIQLQ
jgi:hypothetical protein